MLNKTLHQVYGFVTYIFLIFAIDNFDCLGIEHISLFRLAIYPTNFTSYAIRKGHAQIFDE